MNNIFIKNLTALSGKNPRLTNELQNFIPTELPKLIQENGQYNLSYKEKLIHSSINPLAEAQEIFSRAQNSPVSIHIIYGIGLGYLFQIASLNSKGSVILYEPDLNILWTVFTLVDFSNDISKNNVFIASTFDELSEFVHRKSNTENTPELLSLPSQRNFDSKGFEDLVKKIRDMVGTFHLNLKFTKKNFYLALKLLLQNFKNLEKEIPLLYLKDKLQGKTAVLVSAGPTLDKNIETLKKYRDKYVLFCVGTALKTLYQNDIKPDFVSIIETYNSSKQLENLDLQDVYFITEPYSNPALRNFKFKKVFSHIGDNMPINHFWSEIIEEKIDEYNSKGTVSYTILNSARLLGCEKIILVGQDLAYLEGQCYSKDSVYKDLTCEFNKDLNKWEITAKDMQKFADQLSPYILPENRLKAAERRLSNLNNSLYYVKGINGGMLPTESVYATFVNLLSEYTRLFNDRKYINTSLLGAQIDGFENISLEEALKDCENVGDFELETEFTYPKSKVYEKFKSKLEELKSSLPLIEQGKSIAKNLSNNLKRQKNVNQEILKSLKKLSLNYISLTEEFSKKSQLFEYIITSNKIDLDYEMKMLMEFNYPNVLNISEKMSKFYNDTELRIKEVENIINESINSAG